MRRGKFSRVESHYLHGVTSVAEGTRKSLFIVDSKNGLGDPDIVELTSDDIVLFLAQRTASLASSTNDRQRAGKRPREGL